VEVNHVSWCTWAVWDEVSREKRTFDFG